MVILAGIFVGILVAALCGAVLGIHGLLLGRVPGRRLQRLVKRPRVWGAGALLLVVGVFWSPTVAVIGVGLLAIGHVGVAGT
ncbi:hypothetical protein ACFC0C_05700 [Streptomyces sp. NPDC056178]|uniref:hypothetical protein n=1 Tax=unclassified Streptomyces TaxID=2593676 RepID=UPI0035D8C5FA